MPKTKRKLLFAAWSCHNKNYFAYQTWDLALRKVFDEVVTFDPQEETYRYGQAEMNKRFLEFVEKEKPDYIYFWLLYNALYLETLFKIREKFPNIKTINFFGDDDISFDNFSRYYALLIDYKFVSHKKYLINYYRENIKNVFFTCGVNTKIFKPVKKKKIYDVSFIGVAKLDRYKLIKYLIDNCIKVRVFGAGWDKYPDLKNFYGGYLNQEEFVKVINQTKITISLSKSYEGKPGFKAIVFEICACKSFLLSEYFDGYLEFLQNKKEIVMFKTEEELLKKIKYYLTHEKEREKISEGAYKKVTKNYSIQEEFDRIFKKIFEKERSFHHEKYPVIKDKVATLTKKDFRLPSDELKKKLKDFKYVAFKKDYAVFSRYKDYFQIYSLKKSKKDISCCDYHASSRIIGDYLALQIKCAFKNLDKKDFLNCLYICQLMAKKDYFIKNFEKFKDIFNDKKREIIKENNTVFVSIPLVKIYKLVSPHPEIIDKAVVLEFENYLRSLEYHKRLFFDFYTYKLILYLFFFNQFIFKHLMKRYLRKKL